MAQAQLNSAARFRTRKISIRQNLPVRLASEIELDEDQQRGVLGTIETGIEHHEENVSTYHFSKYFQFKERLAWLCLLTDTELVDLAISLYVILP